MFGKARLTEHLSNTQFDQIVNKLLSCGEAANGLVRSHSTLCACGCGQPVPVGRKFVNQTHYDNSKGLTSVQASQFVALYLQGLPKKQLAREYGVALSTVKRLLKRL